MSARRSWIFNVGIAILAGLASTVALTQAFTGPGDVKSGYESATYETRSLALGQRKGNPADLLSLILTPPIGLPPLAVPDNNPITMEKIELGRKLFYDRRLSLNGTISCAMCHIPEQGFGNNELRTAVGFEGASLKRNTPTLYNIAYAPTLFHDGREHSLELQVLQPFTRKDEMANPSIGMVIEKLRKLPDYGNLFEAAFLGQQAGIENLGMAIASYERALLSANSPFDQWYFRGDQTALNPIQSEGFRIFAGKAQCNACHEIGSNSALFTDYQFHDTGIGHHISMRPDSASTSVQLAPGVSVEVPRAVIDSVGEKPKNDLGRYEVTQNPADRWKFKTPTLRNVALTSPYMHNGMFSTLRQVLEYYNAGGFPHDGQDPRIRPLNLTNQELDHIEAFLNTLTGSNVEILVEDAFAVPIGDPVAQP